MNEKGKEILFLFLFFMWIKCMLNVSLNAKDRKPSSALDSQLRGADFFI